jgi:D-aspartate ligase
MKAKVIVIGCKAGGLGVIRSFVGKGVDIIALSYSKEDYAHKSKYVKEWFKIPHPRSNEMEFIKFLIDKSKEWKGSILFDTEDDVAVTLSKNKNVLKDHYKIITADIEQMQIFMEKKNAWQLCINSGVPHPGTFLPKNEDDFKRIKNEIKLPCIFKPVRGYEFVEKFNCKNFEINNFEDYDNFALLCIMENQEVMVQEIVPGSDSNIFKCMTYINSKDEISGMFFYNKIRQNPPRFGVHRVSVSAGYNAEVENLFRKLLKHSGYKGFCTVEFKKDPRDGVLKFIEVNVRMPRMISISTAAGVNFPWTIYNDLVNDIQLKENVYTENLYWIEINSDIYNTLFKRSQENFSLKDYIKPYLAKKKTYSIFSLKDLAPYLTHTLLMAKFRTSFVK